MTKRLKASVYGTLSLGALALSAGTATAATPWAGPVEDTVTVTLTASNGAAAAGEATLSSVGAEATEVQIHVQGAPAEAALTAYLVTGTCDAPGEVQAALGTLEVDAAGAGHGGFSLEQPLTEVVAADVAVQIHATGDEPGESLLCGEVAAAELPLEDAPLQDAPAQEVPIDEVPLEDAPLEDVPLEEAPIEELPVEEAPIDEVPAEEPPVEPTAAEEPAEAEA